MGYSKEKIKDGYSKEEIKDEVIKLMSKNKEWEGRYEKYINKINSVLEKMQKGKASYQRFRKPDQLSRYSSVSKRDGKTYDLRYNGQSVALVTCTRDDIKLKPNITNAKKFGFMFETEEIKQEENDKKGLEWDWDDELRRANVFRSHFKNQAQESETYTQPEHRLENRLLNLFSSKEKPFSILPVKLYNCFFQMPTPLRASDHKSLPTYANQYGGGIDILARVGIRIGFSRLCVMEIKDENKESESQADAMGQAVAYAVFIAQLLRSKSGQKWYDFFMNRDNNKTYSNRGDVPKDLHIDVVTIMPKGDTDEDCNNKLFIEELGTTLHCHSLYYDGNEYDKGNGKIVFTEKSTYLEYVNEVKK